MTKARYRGNKKPMHWWTKNIEELRKKCLSTRRKLKRSNRKKGRKPDSPELISYREAQRELKIEIEKSKKRNWEALCKQVDVDPWGLPYKIVTKKLIERTPIPGIAEPGRIDAIVEGLFPSKKENIWHTPKGSITFPEITMSEIIECATNIPRGKAPGPDGIPHTIIHKVATVRPNILCNAFNSCCKEACFPEDWKVAKLVLLRKVNKPLEQPSSYRPICHLNTVGKFFERVIKRRLELHLSATKGLSDRQYGFCRGRSTIDAISKAMEKVDNASSGPLRRRELCVLVALDVANAFNSAN